MVRLLVKRLALGVLTVWLVSFIVFGATELLPGDVAEVVVGQYATPEAIQAIRTSLGLDRPALQRYGTWLANFFVGDLGTSLTNGQRIGPVIRERLGNTFFLAAVVACIAVPLAILLGVLAAIHRQGWIDRSISVLTLVCVSVPEFFVGYVLIIVLARLLGLFSSMSQVMPDAGLWVRLQAIALPVLTLVLVVLAHMIRMARAAIIRVLSSPYIEMAYLKGIPEWRVVLRHALPNAVAPIANVVAFNLAYLVVGVIIVEVVFVYPGMGQLMVDAVAARDVPVIQACGLIFGATYVGLNLAADLVAILSNPRLRLPR